MPHEPDLIALGARLKKAFADKGLNTQDEIRDALGRAWGGKKPGAATISRWFNGHTHPDRYMPLLTRFLGVSAEFLQWGEEGVPAMDEPDELTRLREDAARLGLELVPIARKPVHAEPRQPPAYSGVSSLEGPMVEDRPRLKRRHLKSAK